VSVLTMIVAAVVTFIGAGTLIDWFASRPKQWKSRRVVILACGLLATGIPIYAGAAVGQLNWIQAGFCHLVTGILYLLSSGVQTKLESLAMALIIAVLLALLVPTVEGVMRTEAEKARQKQRTTPTTHDAAGVRPPPYFVVT
jgi:hypothetical protein